ncbi:MAG: hypothetical protein AB2A00_03910 [Myxococcota bacterium]
MLAGHARECLDALEGELRRELEAVQRWPALLGRMDAPGLHALAAERTQRQENVTALQRALQEALDTLSAEERASPEVTAALARTRALARRLHQADAQHHALASSALRLVRQYVGALAPPPAAYTRQGRALPTSVPSALRRRA